MNRQNLGLALLLVGLLNLSCSTLVKYDEVKSAQWNSRALIKDKSKKRTQVVYANILAEKPSRLRIDVNTSLGNHLATLSIQEDLFYLLLNQQRQFITGKAVPAVMNKVTPIPIPPQTVINALFEIEPSGTEWSCTRDKNDMLKECLNNQSSATIAWSNRQGARRTVAFSEKQFEIQFDLMNFQPNVQVRDEQFKLLLPEGFLERKL